MSAVTHAAATQLHAQLVQEWTRTDAGGDLLKVKALLVQLKVSDYILSIAL